jgi:hypothetical protein
MADNIYDKPVQVRENFTLNLDLFNLAFGHIKPPFPQISVIPQINPFGFVKALRGSFRFRGNIGNEYTMPVKIDDYEIPCEPVLGIFGSKNVIETKLTRLDPKTKKQEVQNIIEETGLNNYQIRIRGVIYNEQDFDEYPEDDVVKLTQLWETPGSRTIENAMLNMVGINKICIVGFDKPEMPGYPGAQPFELRCLSDETELYPLELV